MEDKQSPSGATEVTELKAVDLALPETVSNETESSINSYKEVVPSFPIKMPPEVIWTES